MAIVKPVPYVKYSESYFEVKHGEEMTLSSMIDAGVHKLGDRLQEISSSASKEFALEKAMGKMKDEWEHVRFVCEPYRESGVSILASVDDIQVRNNTSINARNTSFR